MKIIVDASIIFSAIVKNGFCRAVILDCNLYLLTPEYVVSEIDKHKDEITYKANISNDELNDLLNDISNNIYEIPKKPIVNHSKKQKK